VDGVLSQHRGRQQLHHDLRPDLNFSTTSNPSSSGEVAQGVAYNLTGGGSIFVAGNDFSPGDYQMRLEKRFAVNGSSIWNYTSNPSSSTDDGQAVASDGPYVYLGGYDLVPGGSDSRFRIEKVFSSNGSNVWNYTSNPTSGLELAYGIANESAAPGYVYIAGTDGGGTGGRMRLEKAFTANGSNVWNYTSDPTSGFDIFYGVAFDSTGFVYAAGRTGASTSEWRVEAIFAGNGSNAWNYTSSIGAGASANAIGYDGVGSLFVSGTDTVLGSGNPRIRVEKMNATSGARITTYTSNPSSTDDNSYALAVGPPNFVTIVGFDEALGAANDQWHIERLTG
jgi:hypothetical protein